MVIFSGLDGYETSRDLSKFGPCNCPFLQLCLIECLMGIQLPDLSCSDNLYDEKQVRGRINQLIDSGMVDYPLYSASPR